MADNTRKSVDLLPAYFRTEKNNKFLSSTLDQFMSVPQLNRVDAFVGSKNTPNYSSNDRYIEETNLLRQSYQLEPALVVKTLTQEIKKAFALDDLLNQIDSHNGHSSNLDRLLHPQFYSYDPKIDWDKFINFREYFWLPTGPDAVSISGDRKASQVEYTVTDASDGVQFFFNNSTTSQQLILYRGTTYVFNVKSIHNFYIKYTNTADSDNMLDIGITGNGTNNGQIVVTITGQTPEYLFYTSSDDQLATGPIFVKDPEFNSSIDVEAEILGKKSYTSATGVKFINGLKIKFIGTVFPESYREAEFIVDGVGKSINLIKFNNLATPDVVADLYNTRFDGTNFDQFPFDNFSSIPLVPEYVTISKASKDLNPWSRYNRWFHSDVIQTAAAANGTVPVYPAEYRATRPIVEFLPNIQLFDFGTTAIPNVDLVDTVTTNAFLQIENQSGFYIDGILLEEGFRVIFTADPDPLVRGKVFRVQFSLVGTNTKIDLVLEDDQIIDGSCALVKKGSEYGGTSWWYNGTTWNKGQQRSNRNQAPLFDLFDDQGANYSERNYTTDFAGNKIFGYGIGTGANDPILGFPLLYRNVGVEGTYLFKNYFATEEFLLVKNNVTGYVPTAKTYFKINGVLTNVWVNAADYNIPLIDGIYDVPLNLSNNPLNDPISDFTLTELSNHVNSMVDRDPNFTGVFPGVSNLKDLPEVSQYGTKLISNLNSLAFAQHFISDEENSIISAIRLVGENYYQFKLNLIKTMSSVDQTLSPVDALDASLQILNQNKTTTFPYYYSDMIPHGSGTVIRNYNVTDSRNTKYAIPADFNLTQLSIVGTLVYLNGRQLLVNADYVFDSYDTNVEILTPLERNDVVTVKYYSNTTGSFIPPTPTKLGLYPKFEPIVFEDNTYASDAQQVLQGHDGSITILFGDYRDDILLEFERRIFNNIKVDYRQDLFDVNSVLPGIFRNQEYTYSEILDPVHQDLLKWKTTYSVETDKNLTFDIALPKTFNYSAVTTNGISLPGNWRAIFKMYFDTDRPHITPWEMLGFSVMPLWWEDQYGPAPYTSGNTLLWEDIQAGRIRQGTRTGIDTTYVRHGLMNILPVDANGNLVDIRTWGPIGAAPYLETADQPWKFGDSGPGETAWRRGSYWPFAVQIIMAVLKPAAYSALMFDTSRLVKNVIGQYVYSEDNLFLNQSRVLLPYEKVNDAVVFTAGYSVFTIEAGQIRNSKYLSSLKEELKNSTFNLMHKVGGFVSKDKLEIVIDSVNPNSVNPGILLPVEDYTIHFNVSNPVKVVNISGFLIQKLQGKFVLRGYDKVKPYFTTLPTIHEKSDTYITVGGKSEDYSVWSINVYYPIGQVILYENSFYRATNNHNSGTTFNSLNYSALNELPTINATVVAYPASFGKDTIDIPYTTSYNSIQEVADVMAGYGRWLETQGFEFDEFSNNISETLNWKFAIKEFAYWSSQNWADNSVIAISPFANTIKFIFQDSVVDNIFGSFYDYTLLKADGLPFPFADLSISRTDGQCVITSKNDQEGIFFASLRLVQKEHALILNNTSRFNDVIYDIDTGYRQRRIRLVGFKTANWNGDYFSPGFIYDSAVVKTWQSYQDYIAGDVVEYTGSYYSLDRNLPGKERFDFTDWNKLGAKPVAQLIPNFEYKLNQFEDFYSLEIDNFDISQQELAQHLTGYSSRLYLNNMFVNHTAQYKFFQGFIKEKGTRNALDKLAKASVHNLQGQIDFNEEWAFRIGAFGAYASLQELEFPLSESKFVDNSQLIKFVSEPPVIEYDSTLYITPESLSIKPLDYNVANTFFTKDALFDLRPFQLPVAGYVRLEDVDYTVKSKQDLLNFIPGKTVNQGDTFWVAFDNNNDWGVYRYTRMPTAIIGVADNIAGESIKFTTNAYHGLTVGDIIAVTRFADEINGIYIISEINRLNEIVVKSTVTAPNSTNDFGVLFKFVSSRFEKFDDLVDTKYVADIFPGRKIWVDSNRTGQWEVYEKIDNYTSGILTNRILSDGSFYGEVIISKENSNLLVVSAPRLVDDNGSGQIFMYTNTGGTLKLINSYPLNRGLNQYYENGSQPAAKFGVGLDFDAVNGIIIAGAPYASNVKADASGTTRYVQSTNYGIGNVNDGMVVISTLNVTGNAELRHVMLACQEPANNLEFGYSTFIASTASQKIALVGAPGHTNSTGAVFSYDVAYVKSFDNLLIEVNATATSQIKLPSPGISVGSRFGDVIAGDLTGKRVAVSAPGYSNGKGAVYVYENTGTTSNYTFVQSLAWNDTSLNNTISADGQFGYDIDMDDSGKYLFVSAFNAYDSVLQRGKVVIYEWTGTQYTATQVIDNPSTTNGSKFGFSIESDSSGNILTVTSQGPNYFASASFDEYSTTFDSKSTRLGTLVEDSGSAYVYNRYQEKFIFATELYNSSVLPSSSYGYSTSVSRETIYVSSPRHISTGTLSTGAIHIWQAKDPNSNSWNLLRQQTELVDVEKIKQVKTINVYADTVVDYLEIYDPIKGKIPQTADQEIRFKTFFDPAVYNTGTNTLATIDASTSWSSEHVGELWWDLSAVKYTWYEQGDVEFRKNTWGSVFPGCSIDIYEWVKSDFLPDQWVIDADTTAGLAANISGTPRYVDNSAYVVEQVYSSVIDAFVNVYYFWVKNTVVVPVRQGRQLSAFDVAGLIENPKLFGIKYVEPLSSNSLSVVNVKGSLVNERISLNIQVDDIDNETNRHTEWLLLEEDNKHSLPTPSLEKKLIDSLLGRDSLGNIVPDPMLSDRQKYGIGIRPRQSMFKDRLAALRNFFEYVNNVFANNLITDFCSLDRLNSKEAIPDPAVAEYDIIVGDIDQRNEINTSKVKLASVSCTIENGRIDSVEIVDPGFGYGKLDPLTFNDLGVALTWRGPLVEVFNDQNDSKLESTIDELGRIINVQIVNSGSGYLTTPEIFVRPYTVIVSSDTNSRGRWAKYVLGDTGWSKIQTQSFDTTLYWDLIDWVSVEFNQYQRLAAIVGQRAELDELYLTAGDYVKVLNNGAGHYIILRKTASSVQGTYDLNFDIMYSEKGTLYIKDSIWKLAESQLGWDQLSPYDNNFWDQTADTELKNIILSLRDDIFIGNLKVYWNTSFFAAVKYALTEQKFLDWAFKTSFISVHNKAGELTQRSVYKFQDAQWYEDYLNEIKPYHTKIRNYYLTYDVTEPTNTYTTDFDLPVVYDQGTNSFITLSENEPLAQTTYPYKGWYDNRTLVVDSIVVDEAGTGYIENPIVQIIPASGDTVTRHATAEAVLSSGKIDRFEIIDSGEGYTLNPTVLIIGGGLTSTDTVARASVHLVNGKVRSNLIGMKFDRISKSRLVTNKYYTDNFVGDGVTNQFDLSWPSHPDKTEIVLKINGVPAASSSYEIEDYTNNANGYTQHYTRLFLSSVPAAAASVRITYLKSIDIYSAYDRIANYYDNVPLDSPGANPAENYAQLMSGMEYPGTEIISQNLWYDFTWDSSPYSSLKWDKQSFDTTDLDTIIDGGTVATTGTTKVFSTAAGINPEDIILDGDTFISPIRSYAPEEMIPGELRESIGISVFNRSVSGSATIYNQLQNAFAGVNTVINLSVLSPSVGSISVTYDNELLIRNIDYEIDFATKSITVYSRLVSGTIAVVCMDVGGTGFISLNSNVTEGSTVGVVFGDCQYSQVKSVYVTLNGQRIYTADTFIGQSVYYVFAESNPGVDSRAKITVYGLGTDGKNTITAAFFTSAFKGFSEVFEQQFFNIKEDDRVITLTQPPGTLGPASANSIVEFNKKRLAPPNTTYYEITNVNQTTFLISSKEVYPPNSFDKTRIEVYINGKVVIPAGYYLDDINNNIVFEADTFAIGDVVAITALIDYDYLIRGTDLIIDGKIFLPAENYLRILTFTNHDAALIRTEVYKASSTRMYKISRKVLNDNLVWMSIGDNTLLGGIDFEVLGDGMTIMVDQSIPFNAEDQVIITSFAQSTAGKTVGWKIFRDMIGRTHFKRLSNADTTYLVVPLGLTDTEIHVENGGVLPNADSKSNSPGIIFIAGERIEYLEKNGNILSRIKRATMGTGAKEHYMIGTWVFDQGKQQTIPYQESVVIESTVTTVSTSSVTIELDTDKFVFRNGISLHDQVEVYYGGRLLEKPTKAGVDVLIHDAASYYNPINMTVKAPEFTITGSITSAILTITTATLASVEIKIVQRTGKIWSTFSGKPMFEQFTPQAAFINKKEAISPDQLYYGGDPVLRFNDGSTLLLDDGREIKGY